MLVYRYFEFFYLFTKTKIFYYIIAPGVINIITGYGHIAGDSLARHMKCDKIAFTGSVDVGRAIMKAAAESNLKKVTLELGGKSPNIIFDDVENLDEAIFWSRFGIFYNAGQMCFAGSRIYVVCCSFHG